MIVARTSLNFLLTVHLSFIFSLTSGSQRSGIDGVKDLKNLDSNITKVCEQLRALDKNLTQMYQEPEDEKGEDMLRLSTIYNQKSLELLSYANSYLNLGDKKKVLKAAQDILDHGGPYFLDVDVDEEKIKDKFKWEQETMDKLSMMRVTIGENWFDLWNMYKNLPDYDIPNP